MSDELEPAKAVAAEAEGPMPVVQRASAEADADLQVETPRRPAGPEQAEDVKTKQMPKQVSPQIAEQESADAAVLAASARHTRRACVVAGAAAAAGYAFYRYLDVGPQEDMQPSLLRRSLQMNAALSRGLTQDHVLAPTYPLSRAETLRINGVYGLKRTLEPASWRLQVVGGERRDAKKEFAPDVTAWEYRYMETKTGEDPGHDTKVAPKALEEESSAKMAPAPAKGKAEGDENHTARKPRGGEEAGESYSTLKPGTPGLLLTMEDVRNLPRHELVTQFKCIEGWSQVVHWAGVRMADFLEAYPPAPIEGKEPRYAYMETPDGDYYNGYDLITLRHPQALLVTEMMGEPLTQFHGAPLRLHLPMKYGYKQIKRIGLIAYTDEKPDDYWTELGYDWHAGL